MRFQPFGGAWEFALHIAFGAVHVVSQYMQSRPISLCLDGHAFLRLWKGRVHDAAVALLNCVRHSD